MAGGHLEPLESYANRNDKIGKYELEKSSTCVTSDGYRLPPGHVRPVKMGLYNTEMLKYAKKVGLDCGRARPGAPKDFKASYG